MVDNGDKQCAICGKHAYFTIGDAPDAYSATCPYCGKYQMVIKADFKLRSMSLLPRQRANMSGWLYENQPCRITVENLDSFTTIMAPSFHTRADRLLLAMEKKTEYAGQHVPILPDWISCAWCMNKAELIEILAYLMNVQRISEQDVGGPVEAYKIIPNGWARLEELKNINANSEQCFVAMWFDESLKPIYDNVLAEGILAAGYRPHKVDQREHNNKIDDEIISQIRRSRFIVADFTGHRGGVYYEAGFAKGLGLEVIWTCRKDDIEKLHFDIRQYNCIDWEEGKLLEFSNRLTNRIEAILGRGTYVL